MRNPQPHLKPLVRLQLQLGRVASIPAGKLARLFACSPDTVWRHTTKHGITASDDPLTVQAMHATMIGQLEKDLGADLDLPARNNLIRLACEQLNRRCQVDQQHRLKIRALERALQARDLSGLA
jgi:hypothetical protein